MRALQRSLLAPGQAYALWEEQAGLRGLSVVQVGSFAAAAQAQLPAEHDAVRQAGMTGHLVLPMGSCAAAAQAWLPAQQDNATRDKLSRQEAQCFTALVHDTLALHIGKIESDGHAAAA